MLLGRMSLQLVSCVADGRLLWLTKLCSFRWQDLALICRFGMPALGHKVMAIALTLWLLNSFERAAAWLTCFIVLSNLLHPSVRDSYHTMSFRLQFLGYCTRGEGEG